MFIPKVANTGASAGGQNEIAKSGVGFMGIGAKANIGVSNGLLDIDANIRGLADAKVSVGVPDVIADVRGNVLGVDASSETRPY